MKTYKELLTANIAAVKKTGMHIAITETFSLSLLTHDRVYDTHIIRLLSRWRKKHEVWFPAQFPVTQKRTRDWLKHRVIDESDRLLFMVEERGIYKGHVGLFRFDFEAKSCEIDNIVKGRKGKKGMMERAIRAMMLWGEDALGIAYYTLQTTSDNVRALALYERMGFVETKRVPLEYKKSENGGEWIVSTDVKKNNIKRYDVYMTEKGGIYEAK